MLSKFGHLLRELGHLSNAREKVPVYLRSIHTGAAEDQRAYLAGLQWDGRPADCAGGAAGSQNLSGQMRGLRR